jgi:hypothetical protein
MRTKVLRAETAVSQTGDSKRHYDAKAAKAAAKAAAAPAAPATPVDATPAAPAAAQAPAEVEAE